MVIFLLLIALPGLIVFIDFIGFLINGKRNVGKLLIGIAELGSLLILPFMYGGFGKDNVCCADQLDTAAFSPEHQLTVIVIIVLSLICYFYSKFRSRLAPPIVEVLINATILIGIVLNVFIAFHSAEFIYGILGTLPIILLGILMLIKNQQLFLEQSAEFEKKKNLETIAWKILSAKPLIKFPILLALCLPILIIISSILLLFGQKPDSIVRAFTDTYKHGFSQWDYKCDNVDCGGHYLCSVAAKGHKKIVNPQRYGVRNGGRIICNRQLLISNAFEDFIQEKTPFFHKSIRSQYNRVGNFIHRYYGIFNYKIVSDFIYILMKPLEWVFLLTLYTLDRKPENRIAKQYLSDVDRQQIDKHLATQQSKI